MGVYEQISIHALLAESDRAATPVSAPPFRFLSTLSLRRATCWCWGCPPPCQNFYPRSPCGERPADVACGYWHKLHHFYPRSPCGERLREPTAFRTPHHRFLSTLSLRRATAATPVSAPPFRFLSTLSLRRATTVVKENTAAITISIHALLAESDSIHFVHLRNKIYFYPRSPCGERQRRFCGRLDIVGIFLSTLSLRRATTSPGHPGGSQRYFYPRSPCGERPYGRINDISRLIFLSTLSLRRATIKGKPASPVISISIHALLAESDCRNRKADVRNSLFLSTLSLRRAT